MHNVRAWDMTARTCPYCGEVYPSPAQAEECKEREVPAIPDFKPADRFRIKEELFIKLYPTSGPEQNIFAIAGELSKPAAVPNGQTAAIRQRTMNCEVFLDKGALAHVNRIRMRWLGEEGNIKANRLVTVAEKDVVKIR